MQDFPTCVSKTGFRLRTGLFLLVFSLVGLSFAGSFREGNLWGQTTAPSAPPTADQPSPAEAETDGQQRTADKPADGPSPSAVDRPASAASNIDLTRALLAMGLGIFVVLALMIGLRAHAFVALILGALTISAIIPLDVIAFSRTPEPHVVLGDSEPANIISRVTSSLGNAVVGIGVLIAMAAIIGKCMLVSGAADQIVKSALQVLGEKRAALAMMVSGFVLSIPVFFDTVFYLLVPLARSLYRRTGRNYLLYLCAIAAGGAITHTLVPPTPGPLLVAEALGANLGVVMMIGIAVGIPSAFIGLAASSWLNQKMPIEMRPLTGSGGKPAEEQEVEVMPSLALSLLPVLLPVLLIAVATVYSVAIADNPDAAALLTSWGLYSTPEAAAESLSVVGGWLGFIGNPNMAMICAALFSIYLCWKVQGHSFSQLAEHVEEALLSGGVIILITSAGGAFGALLAMTQVQDFVKSLFAGTDSGGLVIIVLAYAVSALIKVAQGSSTVAMIIASSLIGTISLPLAQSGNLGFHPAYLVPVIGSGSLLGSWMNDSGFWVFAKMGVLSEGETLRSWTILLGILSVSGFAISLLMALFLPLV